MRWTLLSSVPRLGLAFLVVALGFDLESASAGDFEDLPDDGPGLEGEGPERPDAPPSPTVDDPDEEPPPFAADKPRSPEARRAPLPPLPVPALELVRYTLPNGLRVVLNREPSSPSVAVCVTYDVGSRDELEGQTGFAHLFEHLMFQGSRNVAKGGHFAAIVGRGGRANGTTNKERTNYFQVLPAGELDLALWLEADRMKSLAINRSNFDNQRKVVQEEYRMRYANRTYALGALRLSELVFQGDFAYQHPTIGYLEDLDAADLQWVRDFHTRYYAPDNAVLSVSGAFEADAAMALVEKHFGDARPRPEVERLERPGPLGPQSSERFSVMVDESAKSPAVLLGWRIPEARSKERRALELASEVLTGGASGRLYQSLVLEKASALQVASWTSHQRGPGLFGLKLVVAPLSNVDTLMKWLEGELKRLRWVGPSVDELDRARARLETARLRALERNQERVVALGEHELFFGDASLLLQDLAAYRDIEPEDVRKAAHAYLRDTRRSIVEVYPPGWVRDLGPVITTTTHVVQKGDTLSGIASKYGTTPDAIAKENRIQKGRPIHPGQRLLVTLGAGASAAPKVVTKTHVVKRGDTLIGIARKYGSSADAIAKENKLSAKRPIFPGQELRITVEVVGPRGAAQMGSGKSGPSKSGSGKSAPSKSAPSKSAPSKSAPSKSAPSKGGAGPRSKP